MTVARAVRRAAALCAVSCALGCDIEPGPPLEQVDLGASLGATRADPLLLTVAAARPRTQYLVDQGYTLAWDEAGVPSFTTGHAGDLGVTIEADGYIYATEGDLAAPVTIAHTASDALVLSLDLDGEISAEVWFVAATSRTASVEVRVKNGSPRERRVAVIPWLRRCDEPLTKIAPNPFGLRARRSVAADPLLAIVGPGTFLTDFADALVADEPSQPLGRAACSEDAANDVGLMVNRGEGPGETAGAIALRVERRLAAGSETAVRFHRATVDAAKEDTLPAELDAARALSLSDVLREGRERLASIPDLPDLPRADALVYRSSFTLLDQVMMPAEGKLAHDYYVFSREPTWWFARLGENVHESLAMILTARLSPRDAVEAQRVLIDRVEPDGYLPYSVGPVVEQTQGRTAAAPLFSYVSWEIAQRADDPAFLADAYEAGKKLHGFWIAERDVDHDGLAEWGGVPITESLRDLNNVIWTEVAPPDQVEAVDLNCMLVMEERSLASMADALGLAAEASAWRTEAEARAARINAAMWDPETGFYYHVARDAGGFDYAKKGDLKRMEIAGLLPIWAGIVPEDRRLALYTKLADPEKFFRANGVASLAADDPFYAPSASSCCRWNGPVWVPWQLLLMRGLTGYGEAGLAKEIALRTRTAVTAQLAATHQFRELYDPDDAAAPNASMPNYLWSSLVALMMIEAADLP